MDKVEYQQRLEELTACIDAKDFAGARKVADKVDWRRVKSVKTLGMVADVYEHEKDYEKTKDILTIAHTRTSIGRGVLARLVETCLQLGQVEQAEKYFREFAKVAQNDNSRYVLQYKLYKAKQAPLDAQIAVLEEYREKEYTERWAYELAELYSRAGEHEKCIEACDDLILWFSEGKYVLKAMELKKQYEPLSEKQQVLYTRVRDAENERARAEAAAKAEAEAKARAEEEARIRAEEEARARAEAEEAARREAEEKARLEAEQAAREAETAFPQPTEDEDSAFPKATVAAGAAAAAAGSVAATGAQAAAEAMPEAEMPSMEIPEEAPSRPTAPEDLKNRLLKTFQNMFGKKEDKKKADFAEETPQQVDEPEEELVIRELVSDEAILNDRMSTSGLEPIVPDEPVEEEPIVEEAVAEEVVTEEAVAEGVVVEEPVAEETVAEEVAAEGSAAEKKEEAFNLDAFLNETAGSFSEEIETGGYEATTDEEPARLGEELHTAEEEAIAMGEDLTTSGPMTATESIQAALEGTQEAAEVKEAVEETVAETTEEATAEAPAANEGEGKKPTPHYNLELEIPDEDEPTLEEKKSRTIPLSTIGQNTVPISIDKILSEETAEEQRIRILNKARPTRMSEEQRKIFTYFARIPGMDSQILEALSGVYAHAGERTSLHGNIGVMGARGTGKTRLSEGLVIMMCKDLDLDTAKIARITGEALNEKDPAKIVSTMAGGFLIIEDVSMLNEETVEKLNQAMEFRTDCMVAIIEDEKTAMRAFLKNNPTFAAKFDKMISIPVFTNDELVTFARTYAAENDCQLDDLGILALYTKIGNLQTEEKPVTISEVRDMVDAAIEHASKGRRRSKWGRDSRKDTARLTILHEKDFE